MAHYVTGDVYRDLFNANSDRCDYLLAAREHYTKVLKLNPDINEAGKAKKYLNMIAGVLRDPRIKGCQ